MSASRLNVIGVVILLLGVTGAVLRYRLVSTGKVRSVSEWQDTTLPLTDSKANIHDIEMYGGKLEVVMVKVMDWLQEPTTQAFVIVAIAMFLALGCFIAARQRQY